MFPSCILSPSYANQIKVRFKNKKIWGIKNKKYNKSYEDVLSLYFVCYLVLI